MSTIVSLPRRHRSTVAVACLALLAAQDRMRVRGAAASAPSEVAKHETYLRFADHVKLYHDQDNEVFQSFALNGVYQGQYWAVKAREGDADGWENRRFYLGAAAEFLHQVKLQVQVKLGEDFDPVYDGLHTAFMNWTPSQSISLSVGRLDYFSFVGAERSVSSSKISTFERDLLANQTLPQEVVGALVEGKRDRFSGHAGVLSGSINDEFTDFAGGYGLMAGLSYDLPLFYEAGNLHLDYVFNNGNPSNTALKSYDHSVTLWHRGTAGPFGLILEWIGAHGLRSRPDAFGVTVLSTWMFAGDVLRKGDAFQAVLRYQFGVSDGENGLLPEKRYEQEVLPSGSGDHYQAVYAGINYLIYEHRLKLMNGVEYSRLRDSANDGGAFDGWTFLTGVRLFF